MNKQQRSEVSKRLSFLPEISLSSYPPTLLSSFKRSAFTLAETLIVLAIIGVVAAITIPSLIQKYNEYVTVNRLIKTYSVLEQAFTAAVADNGTIDGWCSSDERGDVCTNKIFNTIKPYIKSAKECEKKQTCLAAQYTNRFTNFRRAVNFPSLVFSDGAVFALKDGNGDGIVERRCKANKNTLNSSSRYFGNCGYIYVDINGKKGPNIVDLDLFTFKIYKDGISPSGTQYDSVWTESFDNQCLGNGYVSGGCTAWIIMNKNMDYLHCPEKLGWNKARSCKE